MELEQLKGQEVFQYLRPEQMKAISDVAEVAEVVEGVEVDTDAGVKKLSAALAGAPIDILINNAGILSDESLTDMDLDRIRRQFEVNALGPLRVVVALRPNLGRGSKVAIITSRMGSIEDNTSGGRYGYRMSKAAVKSPGSRDTKTSSGG